MPVEKVRHAQRGCLSGRVTWFACALVKEKAEMCADEMPLKAQDKGRMRTCQDMKNNNWRKNRFFAVAQNDRKRFRMTEGRPSAQIYCCASAIASKLALLLASEYICRITVYRL